MSYGRSAPCVDEKMLQEVRCKNFETCGQAWLSKGNAGRLAGCRRRNDYNYVCLHAALGLRMPFEVPQSVDGQARLLSLPGKRPCRNEDTGTLELSQLSYEQWHNKLWRRQDRGSATHIS